MCFKNKAVVVLALLFPLVPLHSDGSSHLFIAANPYGSEIFIDNVLYEKKSPILIRDAAPGEYLVEIKKENYSPVREKINVKPGTNNIYRFTLPPVNLEIDFPAEEKIMIQGKEQSAEQAFVLEKGNYTVGKNRREVYIKPEYRYQSLIDSLNLVIPIFTVFTGALTYNEITNPRYSDHVLSPFTVSAWAVTALLTGTDIALHLGKNSSGKKAFTYWTSKGGIEGEMILREADILFEAAEIEDALAAYIKFIKNYPAHKSYPEALYRAALAGIILGKEAESSLYLNEIIGNYPLPELYDKALKNLAEIKVNEGEYDIAVNLLGNITYATDMYLPDDIRERISEINDMKRDS